MATTKTLELEGKKYTFQYNNNFQISGLVDKNNVLVREEDDTLVETLRKMKRYDDGQTYSKPQPRVKIGDEIIKLGSRYQTPAEKDAVKAYTDSHSSSGSAPRKKVNESADKAFDFLTSFINEYKKSKSAEVLECVKKAAAFRATFLDDISSEKKDALFRDFMMTQV